MAVAEYMLHNREGDHRRWVPGFISDRGYWFNPADNTFVGWIADNRDFYVPETINYLSKSDFVARTISMHNSSPMRKDIEVDGVITSIDMTTEEVTATAENWYDEFVAKNQVENP